MKRLISLVLYMLIPVALNSYGMDAELSDEKLSLNNQHDGIKWSKLDAAQMRYISTLRVENGDLRNLFDYDSVLILNGDKIIIGLESIINTADTLRSLLGDVSEIKVAKRFEITHPERRVYEIGTYYIDKTKALDYLFIWKYVDGKWNIELQSIAQKTTSRDIASSIDVARNKWVSLANAHDSSILAKQMYAQDFIYLNQGVTYQNTSELASVYGYMNNDEYEIELSPISQVMVRSDLAYEIGKYIANGYEGYYCMIWSYVENEWRIKMDSNE